MDDIEKIRRVLISRNHAKLADLLIHSEGELSESSTYGNYLFSTISTYYIKSPPKETDLLNALSEVDKRRIFDAVISVYPYRDHAPEIVHVEYQISFDTFDDELFPETPAIRTVSREYISNLSERALNDVENGDFDSLKSFLGDSKGFYDWLEVEFSTWGNRVQDENLFNILKSGILNRQVLKIEYASYNSEISERKIKPLKICFKNESWYLYAFCLLRNDYRFFKFSRIHQVKKLEEYFTPEITGKVLPKMSEEYANNLGSQTRVIVEVDSKMSWRVFDELEVLEHLENGNLRCAVNIPDISWGISYLLSFGSGIKVIEPDSVKNMLLQEIEKMLKNAK